MIIALISVSCTEDSPDDLFVPITVAVTYEDNIQPIISDRCTGCHNDPPQGGAPMPLLTYEQVVEAVENRDLWGRISSTDINFLMPLGGTRLPNSTIAVFEQWIADGLLENNNE